MMPLDNVEYCHGEDLVIRGGQCIFFQMEQVDLTRNMRAGQEVPLFGATRYWVPQRYLSSTEITLFSLDHGIAYFCVVSCR
jgi:hypothetical protein